MTSVLTSPWTTWGIAALATVGVITRPFSWPEFVWAVAGAAPLVLLKLLPPAEAWSGIAKGADVYLFLTGMMLLSELARQEGLFDWLAAHAAARAKGSAARLFTLVFTVGTVVTVFLSNDATVVVLTPAVAAVVKTAEAKEPLPYLFICAFIASAPRLKLLLANPSTSVTSCIAAVARGVAAPGTEILAVTGQAGVPYIATRAEAAVAGRTTMELMADHGAGCDAAFADLGLSGAREVMRVPVIGLAEAAMLTACMLGAASPS